MIAKTAFTALAAALLSLPHASPAHAQAAESAMAPARFSVEVVGQGPDMILIPGLATPREVWRPTAEALKDGHRIHLVQLRGFGEPAGANAEGPVLEAFVEELADYIEDQGLAGSAVVGHSLGGLAALMLAIDHGDLPARVMVVDALPFYGVLAARPGETVTAESIEPQASMLRGQLAATYGKPVDADAARQTAAGQALAPASRAQVAEWVAAADPRVTGQLVYDDLTTDLRERVSEIDLPVTLVFPWNETYPTQAQADAFYRSQYAALPQTTFVGVGPSGHFVMLDRAEEMQAAIEAFLGS